VRLGELRRLAPISRVFGFDRGLPIDRYYIERFLSAQARDIRGRVLEIGDSEYTTRFGGGRVTRSDVLDRTAANARATIVADLTRADGFPSAAFDCVICTQTLQFIYDVGSAVQALHRMLKPAGILLLTVPVVSQICPEDMERTGEYWRFTDAAVRRLLGDVFGPENVSVDAHGNVLVAVCFLHGLATHELERGELDFCDPDYQVLVTARAVRSPAR